MKGTCTGTAVYSNALSACVRARRSRIRVRARYSSTRKRTVTMMASATIVPQPLVLPQPPKTANAHPFQPFADGRFRRNFSVASNCLLPCCLPRGADLRAFKDEYQLEEVEGLPRCGQVSTEKHILTQNRHVTKKSTSIKTITYTRKRESYLPPMSIYQPLMCPHTRF